jgi:hypothetical protein
MKKIIMTLVMLSSVSAFANCQTSDTTYQKIDCSFKDKATGERIKLRIRCENNQYVISENGAKFQNVADVLTAETEEESNVDITEFKFAGGLSLSVESKSPLTHTFPHGEFWKNNDNEEVAYGRCFAR